MLFGGLFLAAGKKKHRRLRSKISRRLRFATFPLEKVHRGLGWLWSGRKTSNRSREFLFPLTRYVADDPKRTIPALHTQNLPKLHTSSQPLVDIE